MMNVTYLIIIPKDFDIKKYMENNDNEYIRNEIILHFKLLKQTGSLGEHTTEFFEEIVEILKIENFIFSEIDGCGTREDIIVCIGDENIVSDFLKNKEGYWW